MLSAEVVQELSKEYFAKPMHWLFRTFELIAYSKVNLDIRRPILDLGCGTGAFGQVFCNFKDLSQIDLGTDLNLRCVRLVSRRSVYALVFQSDARAIPIKTNASRFVLCNGTISTIEPCNSLVFS
jgi:trans-aconitate methyltransferase